MNGMLLRLAGAFVAEAYSFATTDRRYADQKNRVSVALGAMLKEKS